MGLLSGVVKSRPVWPCRQASLTSDSERMCDDSRPVNIDTRLTLLVFTHTKPAQLQRLAAARARPLSQLDTHQQCSHQFLATALDLRNVDLMSKSAATGGHRASLTRFAVPQSPLAWQFGVALSNTFEEVCLRWSVGGPSL